MGRSTVVNCRSKRKHTRSSRRHHGAIDRELRFRGLVPPDGSVGKVDEKDAVLSKDDDLPILVAIVMGLQHAFAMVGGLIVPPYVVMRFSVAESGPGSTLELQQYAIACSLILSGLFTVLNCIQFKIPGTKYVFGTGMLSVLGTSF